MHKYLVTAPTAEPLEIDELALHLRLADDMADTEATMLSAMITAARMAAEKQLNRVLITQTWEITLDKWNPGHPQHGSAYGPGVYWPNPRLYSAHNGQRLALPVSPVQSITSIKYQDANNNQQTLASNQYQITGFEGSEIIPVYGVTWPDVLVYHDVITVRWVAGYGDTSAAVPAPIKQWMLCQIGNYYENREQFALGQMVNALPFVDALLAPYKLLQA